MTQFDPTAQCEHPVLGLPADYDTHTHMYVWLKREDDPAHQACDGFAGLRVFVTPETHPTIHRALYLLDADNGAPSRPIDDAYPIPVLYASLLPYIERTLHGLAPDDLETLVAGEHTEQRRLISGDVSLHVASDFLTHYFDGWYRD